MSADDEIDARGFIEELTPIPIDELRASMSPCEMELKVANSANAGLRLELAGYQATIDELRELVRVAREDRRTLARLCEAKEAKIKDLERQLAAKKGTP